jgi:succinate dehydrogenase / fumarate reductase membrane anchor subunit
VVRRKDAGAAHNGLDSWYGQRLSAVVLLVLLPLPFALLVGVYTGKLDQLGLLNLLDSFASRLLHTALIAAVIAHAYLGLKVIIEDYVHTAALRVPLIGAMLVVTGISGLWWLALIWAWGG